MTKKKAFAVCVVTVWIWFSGFWAGLIVRAIQHVQTSAPAVAEAPAPTRVALIDSTGGPSFDDPATKAPSLPILHRPDGRLQDNVAVIQSDGASALIIGPQFMLAGYMGADGKGHALTEADLRACQIPAAVGQ